MKILNANKFTIMRMNTKRVFQEMHEMEKPEHKIPPGYKKTEIGIIPEDWEVKKLGKVGINY